MALFPADPFSLGYRHLMFITRRPVPGHPTFLKIQVCENTREGKKVKQKVVKHIGTCRDEMEQRVFERTAHLFIEESERIRNNGCLLFDARDVVAEREIELTKQPSKNLIEIDNLQEIKKIIEGPRDIFSYAAQEERLLEVVPLKDRKLLADLIAARITEPASKKRTHENLQEYAGFECSRDKWTYCIDASSIWRIWYLYHYTYCSRSRLKCSRYRWTYRIDVNINVPSAYRIYKLYHCTYCRRG